MKKIMMTCLSVCSLGVSCNEMIDTPMLLVVGCRHLEYMNIWVFFLSRSSIFAKISEAICARSQKSMILNHSL